MTEKASRFTGKKIWLKVGVGVVAASIFYGMGSSGAKVEVADKKVNYDKLVSIIEKKEKEVDSVQKKLEDIDAQYKEKEAEFTEALKVVDNKKAVESEIADLTKKLDEKKGEITKLDGALSTKQKELSSIEGLIKKKKEQPINLPAGTFIVGKDIPESRYVVTPVGDGSNFAVYTDSGDLKVNTILGDGDFGEREYVFFAVEGDIIQSESTAKLTPVE